MVPPADRSFGSLLRRYRRAAGLTQGELAQRAGYNVDYIGMLERGMRPAPVPTAQVLADALELEIDERTLLEQAAGSGGHSESPSTFGQLLKRHRLAAGLTQEQLAERVYLSARTISDLERGPRSVPRWNTVELLTEALGLSAENRMVLEAAIPRRAEVSSWSIPPRSTLPAEVTPVVGRERDEAQVVRLLQTEGLRLLTLTGPGGVGKTRLAMRVAATLEGEFDDGVTFVPLAPIRDSALVVSAIAGALGLREVGGTTVREAVIADLRERRCLLVLDNFEHVLEAAPVIAELLSACPGLKALVTSRAVLRLRGEQEMEVFPLGLPRDGERVSPDDLARYPAVALFVQRARSRKPELELTPASAFVIAEICRRLDGLPLAIELAAARIKVLPPEELLARLDRRLQVLVGGTRDAPERQRTLRQTMDWSYGLLSEQEQVLLAHLSVFAGGCTLEAAEAVCNPAGALDVPEGITSLVDNSLVRQEEGSRFTMLETVREYAAERLRAGAHAEEVHRRHALYYVELAERAEEELFGANQAAWFRRLSAEVTNLRAALAWAMDHGEAMVALRLGGSLWRFWQWQGAWGEWRGWLEAGLARSADAPAPVRAKALWAAGWMAHFQGDYGAARTFAEENLRLSRGLGDPIALRHALNASGLALLGLGEAGAAIPLFEDGVEVARTLGRTPILAASLFNLGRALHGAGRVDDAIPVVEEALVLFRQGSELYIAGHAARTLGAILLSRGEYRRAADLFREALELDRETGHVGRLIADLEGLAAVTAAVGRPGRAARLLGVTDGLRDGIDPSLVDDQPALKQYLEDARETVGDEAWNRAREEGRAMRLEEAVAAALEEA